MLAKIRLFFESLNDTAEQPDNISLEIACAVLLCEVMKADGHMADEEQEHIATVLTKHFTLTPIEVDDIINQAIEMSENANDFYQFTSKLNQHYSPELKTRMVEMLWQLAYADGELSSIEEHIIRKIADLLHLRHNEYIHAKMAAMQHFNQGE